MSEISSTNTNSFTRRMAAAAAILLVVATVLGLFSRGANVLGWDLSLAVWIQRWEGTFANWLYRIGDVLGTTSLAATITVIALFVALIKQQLRTSLFLILVLCLRLAGIQLKPLFDSPRPTVEHVRLLEIYDGTGYPSGHSMTVAMVATMLILLTWRYIAGYRLRRAIAVISIAAVLLVGWSRVWAGAHWPSDVLGGWSFGVALVLIAWIVSNAVAVLPVFRRYTAAENATNRKSAKASQ